jgi:cyanophycin synthetase
MGYRHCNVGACLNVASDHLGLRGVDTLEDLAAVKRVVVETARDTAVLNADDVLCLKMADYTTAEHVCYVTMDHTHALVKAHIQAGGRAAVVEEGITGQLLTLYDGGSHIPLLFTHEIPATLDGRALHNVQNALFAAAMAYSMDVALDDIRNGLRTFDSTFFQVPGRMNVFEDHPFRVILDYAHNPTAVRMMVELAERLAPDGRRICVITAPGDRRDEDIREIGRVAAGHFDHYICRQDDNRRGREDGEVPELIRKALRDEGVPDDSIRLLLDEQEAVNGALEMAGAGDLVLVFGDAIQRCWRQISEFRPGVEGGPVREAETERPAPVPKPAPGLTRPPVPAVDLDGELIRDERGVRLARDQDD